jgi:hypothetical protein
MRRPRKARAAAKKNKKSVQPGYARAIGQAAGEMALLENRLGEAMAALLGIEAKLGRIIYLSSHTAFGRVATLDVIASSVLPHGSATLEHLRGLTKRAREVLTHHHNSAHEVWDASSDAKKRTIHARKLGDQSRTVKKLASEVADATKSLHGAGRKRARKG